MTPTLKKKLADLFKAIETEAEANPSFKKALYEVFELVPQPNQLEKGRGPGRASNRRSPALVDPIELARSDEATLRAALATLSVEQLKDIIAAYGMDQAKLAMKWKDADRIIAHIVEFSLARAKKGDVFMNDKTSLP